MKKSLSTIVLVLFSLIAMAQEENQLNVDAQLRTRFEYNNGAISPRNEGESPATFINERARLSVDWQRKNLELKVSVQHTGVWGQDDIKDRNGRVAMNEAWAKLKFGEGFFAQIGRQQLSYDDERILGTLDWNVAGNWHDALRLGYEEKTNKLHLILALNRSGENIRGDYFSGKMPYKSMQTLWYHYQSTSAPLGISLLAMNLGRQAENKTKYMQTFGTDVTYKPGKLDLHGAFYYQTGKDPNDNSVSAWMASAKAGYKITPIIGINAGYDYLSGNDGNGKNKAFDALYGTHHKFYGFMDYFPGKLNLGLQDIQAGITAQTSSKVSMLLNYHYFLTAQKPIVLYDYPGLVVEEFGRGLGHEVDYQITAKLMKDVTLMAGYSFMRGTKTMDIVKGGNHKSWQDWGWIQLNINPRIFTSKW